MRRIYVSMDTLLKPTDHPDPYLHAGIAPYARPFLTWAAGHGKVILVTDHAIQHAVYLLQKLNCEDKVVIKPFEACKTELLTPHEDIYLVDSLLTPSEISWFTEHGLGDRVVPVGMHEGVTQATKQALESKFTAPKKDHK